ncbi:MAG: uracil-DNA glycosylase [Verrucomicrobiota bacterium]|nr:uracil-DNA glycosylase [Verrucomicrobiota bacterium]
MTDLATDGVVCMEASWANLLCEEFEKPYMKELRKFLTEECQRGVKVYPPAEEIFAAFSHFSFDQLRVVIIGQDPYHGPGQAHGLAFSVPKGISPPPSLQNIFAELREDVGVQPPTHGFLLDWVKQGVLLLNTGLTVRAGEAKSHCGKGWEIFTDRVVELICAKKTPVVFLLWGKAAADKVRKISVSSRHLVLQAAHPSPFSARSGFFGCRHFSKTNEFLRASGYAPICWNLS